MYNTPLEDVLKHAREKFPKQPGFPDISLVIPHAERKRINKTQNEATKPSDSVFIEGEDGPIWLYVGIRLIAHLCGKQRGVCNGGFYTILCVGETVKVRCELTQGELDLPLDFVKSRLRLSHAVTQASVQGSTLSGRVRVYTQNQFFTRRHLYVCSSRATSSSLLEVV
jgi:hypothetical protein